MWLEEKTRKAVWNYRENPVLRNLDIFSNIMFKILLSIITYHNLMTNLLKSIMKSVAQSELFNRQQISFSIPVNFSNESWTRLPIESLITCMHTSDQNSVPSTTVYFFVIIALSSFQHANFKDFRLKSD